MKNILTASIVALFLLSSCGKEVNSPEIQEIDFNKASKVLMDSIRPVIRGSWKIKTLILKPKNFYANPNDQANDTVLYNFGDLHLNHVNSEGYYEKNNDVTGNLYFNNKVHAVGFKMHAQSSRITEKKGPQAFALFEFRVAEGTPLPSIRPTTPEESYLTEIGLINDNFYIEISKDGKSMTWTGMNHRTRSVYYEKE